VAFKHRPEEASYTVTMLLCEEQGSEPTIYQVLGWVDSLKVFSP